jgi:O-acetyl-ADP-ribose deacetylase (regulator of RNase III)
LVNPVNTAGVMGRGIALEFKNRYPEMFKTYQKKCENKSIDIGKLFLWNKEEKWVLLFPTKQHWRYPSQIGYIEEGLKKFANIYDKLGIESIAFPRLGCGNGGLDWNEVRPIMEKYLKNLPIHIYIYI